MIKNISDELKSVLSAFLLSIPFNFNGSAIILFVAFVPILSIVHKFSIDDKTNNCSAPSEGIVRVDFMNKLRNVYFAFFLFNLGSMWWVWKASSTGLFLLVFINSIFMSIPILLYVILRRKVKISVFLIIPIWVSFEYIQYNWGYGVPWLNLGNAFGGNILLVQWYEFTGVLGGTFWILFINVLIYKLFLIWNKKYSRWKYLFITILSIIAPGVISILMKPVDMNYTGSLSCVVVQPTIDPYNEKFEKSQQIQIDKVLKIVAGSVKHSDLIVYPETLLHQPIALDSLALNAEILKFRNSMQNAEIIVGVSTYEKKSSNLKYYNSAVFFKQEGFDVYHKSKLVLGVEKPALYWLGSKFINSSLNIIGGSLNLSADTVSKVFSVSKSKAMVAPVICYESVYSDYVRSFVLNGANILAVITNDGWWGNTPGVIQHLNCSKLRAIETRTFVIRSANMGVSAIIDPMGVVQQSLNYNEEGYLHEQIPIWSRKTFFVLHGSLIGKIALLISLTLLSICAIKFCVAKIKER